MTTLFEASRSVYMVSYAILKAALEDALLPPNPYRSAAETDKPSVLPLWARALAGASANVIIWTIAYPVDLLRSLQQAYPTIERAPSAITLARTLYAEGGVKRLYRGYVATALRAGPVAGIVLPTFELVLPLLERASGGDPSTN